MEKAQKTLHVLLLAGVVLLMEPSARADFDWLAENEEVGHRLMYASGGVHYLTGSNSDKTKGCFVQLIWAGADGTNNPAILSVTNTTGDDVVQTNAWVGRGEFSNANGRMNGGMFANASPGRYYYVRIWSQPSPDFKSGVVPMFPTNRYGDSRLWLDTLPNPPDQFDFGGATGLATTRAPKEKDSNGDGLPDWWVYYYFGSFTNAVSPSGDADTDTVANASEYAAGTNPRDADSFPDVGRLAPVGGGQVAIQWQGMPSQLYSVHRGTNAYSGTAVRLNFSTAWSNLAAGTGGWLSWTDTVNGAGPVFYRIVTSPVTNW